MPDLARPSAAVRDSFIEAARDLRDEGWLPDSLTCDEQNAASRRVIEANREPAAGLARGAGEVG